jgi:hypothetical protein
LELKYPLQLWYFGIFGMSKKEEIIPSKYHKNRSESACGQSQWPGCGGGKGKGKARLQGP